jgi:hypothetical protein
MFHLMVRIKKNKVPQAGAFSGHSPIVTPSIRLVALRNDKGTTVAEMHLLAKQCSIQPGSEL